MDFSLTLTNEQHTHLQAALFPGDGLEAAAILLCGTAAGRQRHRLIVQSVHPIPLTECSVRSPNQLTWNTEYIVPYLEQALDKGLAVVKVHSHPGGYAQFSQIDDDNDRVTLPAIDAWVERDDVIHGSAVMLPDGRVFGRVLGFHEQFQPFQVVNVVGDDLLYWYHAPEVRASEFAASHIQMFGERTFAMLRQLSVAIVGCSGTGSPVVEQLARYGVGQLTLVDDDIIETRNLNRVLNATQQDADLRRPKVDVLGDIVEKMGTGTTVRRLQANLYSSETIKAVSECDVIFGCMDTVDGRYLLNQLATYYSIPYIDLGVRIDADTRSDHSGDIQSIGGGVHYLKPGQSLISRHLFDMEDVVAAGRKRKDPASYAKELQDGYIRGAPVRRPAVISLNMAVASLGVIELLARLHPFRYGSNKAYEHVQVDLMDISMTADPAPEHDSRLCAKIGLGDRKPLLDDFELS